MEPPDPINILKTGYFDMVNFYYTKLHHKGGG